MIYYFTVSKLFQELFSMSVEVSDRLSLVTKKIIALTRSSNSKTINIVAVSKRQPVEKILSAIKCGHRVFGENRVDEAKKKWLGLLDTYSDVTLHMIGSLQSNKVKEAVALFDVIQTVDRMSLARKISIETHIQKKKLKCFVQVNTGKESQKSGVLPEDAIAFVQTCRHNLGLDVMGLMCIPPVSDNPALHFAFLRELAVQAKVRHLSMGMSSDFETAIGLGATYIRLGNFIFGDRVDP